MEILKSGTENRRYPRVAFKKAVKCRVSEDDVYAGELAQDLSQGGIRLRSNTFVPVNSTLQLKVQFTENTEVLDVDGRVVWVRFFPYSESYQLGVQFPESLSSSLQRIGQYVCSPRKETV